MLHEGNEDQGKSGKQGWTIVRRCIAIATHQGGSSRIGSQIFPEFVQAQIVNFEHVNILDKFLNYWGIHQYECRLHAICGLEF